MLNVNQQGNELLYVRELNAPRELVFDVWTQPEHLSRWWGPDGFTLTSLHMDAVTGGSWKFIMHGPDGKKYHNKIIFTELTKPERIFYKHSGENEHADVSFEVKLFFEAIGSKTKLTMIQTFASADELQRVAKEYGAIEGAKQHLNKLELYIHSL